MFQRSLWLACRLSFTSFVAALCVVSPVWAVPTVDTTTQGNWIGVYGADGYILPNYTGPSGSAVNNTAMNTKVTDKSSLPSFVSGYTYNPNAQGFVWTAGTGDVRAPQDPDNPGGLRNANTAFGTGTWSITLDISEAAEFELGIYGVDWDTNNSRQNIITVNGEPLAFQNFNQGMWGIWTVDAEPGPLTIGVQTLIGNSVISAITFDQILPPPVIPEPASLVIWSLLLAVGGAAAVVLPIRRRRG